MTRMDKITVLAMVACAALIPMAGGALLAAADAHAKPAAVTMHCGAYDVTFRPHDEASRSDAFDAAAQISRDCTLAPR